MKKKGIKEALAKSVMSRNEGAKTRVRVDSELSEEFEIKVGMHQRSVESPLLFALVIDVVTELKREVVLSESMNADDFVLMSETIKGLKNTFIKWKQAFEGKGLKVNLGKTKVNRCFPMVNSKVICGGITKDGL